MVLGSGAIAQFMILPQSVEEVCIDPEIVHKGVNILPPFLPYIRVQTGPILKIEPKLRVGTGIVRSSTEREIL